MNEDHGKAKLIALMRRYNQLGVMLDPALDREDAPKVADMRLILAEMDKVWTQIDAMIELERAIYLNERAV